MSREQLEVIGVDYQEGLERFLGKDELYQRFLKRFSEDKSYSILVESYEANDYEAMFKAVHTLKGVSGNLAIKPLYEKSSALVETLRNKQYDNIDSLFEDVRNQYNEVLNVLAIL